MGDTEFHVKVISDAAEYLCKFRFYSHMQLELVPFILLAFGFVL